MCAPEILLTNCCSSVLPALYQHSKIQASSVIFWEIFLCSHSVFSTKLQPIFYFKNILTPPGTSGTEDMLYPSLHYLPSKYLGGQENKKGLIKNKQEETEIIYCNGSNWVLLRDMYVCGFPNRITVVYLWLLHQSNRNFISFFSIQFHLSCTQVKVFSFDELFLTYMMWIPTFLGSLMCT